MSQTHVKNHFDSLAASYDQSTPFYHHAVRRGIAKLVPKGKRILDYGCGTGEVLNLLKPKLGVGYDLSPKMILEAKKKFKGNRKLSFTSNLGTIKAKFDYILLIDVIEHLENPVQVLTSLRRFGGPDTLYIVVFVSSAWNVSLSLLEALRLKMQEGPIRRPGKRELTVALALAGYKKVDEAGIRIFDRIPVSQVSVFSFKLA